MSACLKSQKPLAPGYRLAPAAGSASACRTLRKWQLAPYPISAFLIVSARTGR
jgi:hypothetical protein